LALAVAKTDGCLAFVGATATRAGISMQVDHRKLRYLYEVVQCGGVRPASEKLDTSKNLLR